MAGDWLDGYGWASPDVYQPPPPPPAQAGRRTVCALVCPSCGSLAIQIRSRRSRTAYLTCSDCPHTWTEIDLATTRALIIG